MRIGETPPASSTEFSFKEPNLQRVVQYDIANKMAQILKTILTNYK